MAQVTVELADSKARRLHQRLSQEVAGRTRSESTVVDLTRDLRAAKGALQAELAAGDSLRRELGRAREQVAEERARADAAAARIAELEANLGAAAACAICWALHRCAGL